MSQIADTGDIGVSIADSAILRLGMGNCPGFFCVSKANNLVAVLNFGSVCDKKTDSCSDELERKGFRTLIIYVTKVVLSLIQSLW